MFAKLLFLFTVIPILELCVLIPLGQQIGTWPTIGIIIFTAIAGALLAKYQGASAWRRIKSQLESGQLPSDSILDGLAVMIASAFLFTPGILTDLSGFILLIPFTRAPIRRFAKKRIEKWLSKEQVSLFGTGLNPFGVEDAGFQDNFYDSPGYDAGYQESNVVIDVSSTTVERDAHDKPEVITIGQESAHEVGAN